MQNIATTKLHPVRKGGAFVCYRLLRRAFMYLDGNGQMLSFEEQTFTIPELHSAGAGWGWEKS